MTNSNEFICYGSGSVSKNLNIKTKVTALQNNLYDYTLKERMRYKCIYEIIEKYVTDNKLILSNVAKITNIDQSLDDLKNYSYNIYCNKTHHHAINLVNVIYENQKNNEMISFLVLNAVVDHEEYIISYDNRYIAKIYALSDKRQDIPIESINPIIINKVNYLPAEIELINIYNILYTGLEYTSIIKQIEQILSKSITQKIGGDIAAITGGDNAKSCYERKKDEMEAIKIALVKDFFNNKKDCILLGPIAVDWINEGNNICPKFDRIQVISSLSSNQLKTELSGYLSLLAMNGKKFNISTSKPVSLMIPKDFRTNRTVFSISIVTDQGIKERPFLELFNTAEFEILPVTLHNNTLIANKYVLLRFLYIDLWIANYIYRIGRLDKHGYAKRQQRLLDCIHICNNIENKVDGTIGVYYDYDVKKKEKMLGQERRFYPYYVDEYYKKNNTLKQF